MRGAARKGGPYREGTFPDDAPARLADMAAVEAIAKGRVPPTHGERLQRIAEALKERRTQFERVCVVFILNREDFSFVIHLDRQPRTSGRREAAYGPVPKLGPFTPAPKSTVEQRPLVESLGAKQPIMAGLNRAINGCFRH